MSHLRSFDLFLFLVFIFNSFFVSVLAFAGVFIRVFSGLGFFQVLIALFAGCLFVRHF